MTKKIVKIPTDGEAFSGKMTSIEVARVTGKQHSNVMRDIRNLLEQLEDRGGFSFELTSYTDKSNRQSSCYLLTKKDCLLLSSGYDANLRAKIINRWEKLEIERIKEERNPEISANKFISAYRKRGKSNAWISTRFEGLQQRNAFTDTLKSHDVKGKGYGACTDAIYKPLFGCGAKGIRKKKEQAAKTNIRDNMSMVELMAVGLSEALATEHIENNDVRGNKKCERASFIS